jgi:membrane-associated phospholipid phosphatase
MNRGLDFIADSVNPLLALLAIVLVVRRRSLACAAATALGVAAIYAVQALDGRYAIWSTFGGDYSTHTAFATSLVFSMAWWVPRLRIPLAVVWVAYMVLIVAMGYHGVSDVVTAAIVGVAVTAPWHLAMKRWNRD